MAGTVCVGWLPFVGRPLSPDEAGFLIVGGQWGEGSSLYGDFWVDRPPVLVAIFEAAAAAAPPLFGARCGEGGLLGLPFVRAGLLAFVAAAASRHQKRGFALSVV